MDNFPQHNLAVDDISDPDEENSHGSDLSENDVNSPEFNNFLDHELAQNEGMGNDDSYSEDDDDGEGPYSDESEYYQESDLDSSVSDNGYEEDREMHQNALPQGVEDAEGYSSGEDMEVDLVNGHNANIYPHQNQQNYVDGEIDSNDEDPFEEEGNDRILEHIEVEYIRTSKGPRHNFIACNGYLYTKKKTYFPTDGGPETETWECTHRSHTTTQEGEAAECIVRLLLKANTFRFSRKRREHTHPPDNADIEVARAKAQLLNQSENSELRTGVIVSRSLEGLSLVAHGRMPDESTLSRTVRRKRAGQIDRPINPTSVEEITLPFPAAYSFGKQGEAWLRWDSRDENRTLMFASDEALEVLSNSAHWFVDGTFSVTPLAYHQLYTIHALVGTVNIPCVYVLMRRRRQLDYERVYAKLKRLGRMHPSDILLDFEVGAINALRNQFPEANLKGCYFHLSKSVWRRIQQTQYAKWAYQNIADFAVTCRMIPAIAFLPAGRMKRALRFLTAYAIHRHHHVLLRDTLRYFAVVYTGTNLTAPTYPREFWSVADRVCDGLPKSNNAVEGWHNGLSTHIGCAHPPLWTFLECLREQNAKQHMKMVHAIQDREMSTNRGSMWVRTQIARMYNRYREHFEDMNTPLNGPTVIAFLKAVAYLYRMV